MKKTLIYALIIVILAILGLLCYVIYSNIQGGKEIDMGDKKILIAYYSYNGNTRAVAEKIQNLTNGDLFEIKPKKEYSKDYNEVVSLAEEEKQKDIRPELVDNGNVKEYEIIFVGTPVWWYTMAGPVKTFLSKNDFSGKIIVPFCTHGGGGASATYTDMQNLAKGATVTEGYTTYEDSAKESEIRAWINKLKL